MTITIDRPASSGARPLPIGYLKDVAILPDPSLQRYCGTPLDGIVNDKVRVRAFGHFRFRRAIRPYPGRNFRDKRSGGAALLRPVSDARRLDLQHSGAPTAAMRRSRRRGLVLLVRLCTP